MIHKYIYDLKSVAFGRYSEIFQQSAVRGRLLKYTELALY